jgi:transposase
MRTRVWWLIGLMAALLSSGFAQTLVLTNGDVNGDNGVDDADLLSVLFAMGQSCPADCPEDLNGDGVVDDADLLTVLFNMGAQSAPEFAGQPNESPGGAFGISLTVRLADWVGTARQVKVQLKPVGTENDPNVPIFQYRASVGGTDTVVRLDNLPAGVYTVRAFPESPGRWLRVEGKLLTEVPWLLAAPTGANKVTVYWDEVPGATGYRVRWGTTSGSYPNSSAVLPATARQYTVSGLVRDREYYFVVEAAYNGLWGPPSEEDSAVPHEGAIRWDSGNVSWIMEDVRRVTGSTAGRDMLDVLGPDGLIYSDSGVIPIAEPEFINEVYLHPTSHIGGTPMSGRKLTVDWKHTAEELYAHYNNTPNTQIARRFQALALLRRGRTLKETAAIVGVSMRTVQKWLTWYRTAGLDELTRRTRGGNRIPVRPLLTPDQQAQLLQHAATQGFRTLREAAAWCRETLGVELSERQVQRLFHRLGFRRKVPRPMAVRADAALQAQCRGFARR